MTKTELQKLIRESVKKALNEQAVGPRAIDLDNNEWRQLSELFSNVRSRKIQLEGLERAVKHLLDNHDPMAAYAIAKNYSDLLEPDEIALLRAISGK